MEEYGMVDVVLINPYFRGRNPHRKVWLFPPLGLGYLAAALQKDGIAVSVIDGTFSTPDDVIRKVKKEKPKIVGVTCNVVTKKAALKMAGALKGSALLVAGGPQPILEPQLFAGLFDVVVVGEGEETFVELVKAHLSHKGFKDVKGLVFKNKGKMVSTGKRALIRDLDTLRSPSTGLFDNQSYQDYWRSAFGYACTLVMTTRGCLFKCNFCSKPVFGDTYRERSPGNIIKELKEVLAFGYNRVWFADDVFTLNKPRTRELCRKIVEQGLNFDWDCLCRIDSSDAKLLSWMKKAGCRRVFYGIESGSNRMLRLMGKKTTVGKARRAVEMAKKAGLETGGFFMVGYPGETKESLLETIRLSNTLPLDYLSYSIAYPLPGTAFFNSVKGRLTNGGWDFEGQNRLTFSSGLPERTLKLAILKGNIQFKLKRKLGRAGFFLLKPFEIVTDVLILGMI
jgi:anaerobic magnesium-protoporphyrin IX monomethyl ester cyclase